MTVPFKKRRTVHPKHMQATPEAVISSVTAGDAAKSNISTASSSSKHSLPCACPVNEVPDVGTKQDVIQVTIKDQQALIARTTMRVLQTCDSQSDAEQAISSIRVLFFKKQAQHERRTDNLANMCAHLNAIPTILNAMTQWKESLNFVSLATDVLKILLFHIPTSRRSLLQLGGTRILIEACEEHWYLPMVKAALAALSNVAPSLTRDAVVIEDCLSFVEKAMLVFDADAQIQRLGNSFQYAFALSKSRNAGELHYSISMLDSLVKNGYEHQVDCMYGTAVAHYLLGEYDKSRYICEAILRNRPESEVAAELHTATIAAKDEEDQNKAKKMAVGGTVAVAAVGLAMLFGGGRRR